MKNTMKRILALLLAAALLFPGVSFPVRVSAGTEAEIDQDKVYSMDYDQMTTVESGQVLDQSLGVKDWATSMKGKDAGQRPNSKPNEGLEPSMPVFLVKNGGTLNLTINGDVTIKGGDGYLWFGGSPAIEVEEGGTLNIVGGEGTLTCIGGSAGSGSSNLLYGPGLDGGDYKDVKVRKRGAAGGGGAGAGIGGRGGDGGDPMCGTSAEEWRVYAEGALTADVDPTTFAPYYDPDGNKQYFPLAINEGLDSNGRAGKNCGIVNIDAPDVAVRAVGGSGGGAGKTDTTSLLYKKKGSPASNVQNWGFAYEVRGPMHGGQGQRGTGGGGYPAAGIGGGGGAGGAGGIPGLYGVYVCKSGVVFETGCAAGGGGGGGGGQGYTIGVPGIGGAGVQLGIYNDADAYDGFGTRGGQGGQTSWGKKHWGQDGKSGGRGGSAGSFDSIQIKSGSVSASSPGGTGIGLGAGGSADNGTKGKQDLQISASAAASLSSYDKSMTDFKGNRDLAERRLSPAPGAYNITVDGIRIRSNSDTTVFWKMGELHKVQYDLAGDIRYEVEAYADGSGIQYGERRLVNPCTLNIYYPTAASGYVVKDQKTQEELADKRTDLPGFQVDNGSEITVELLYPEDSDYATVRWSDKTEGPVWSGKISDNKDLTAYSQSATGLPSYTVSLENLDYSRAEFEFHISYESILPDSRTLMISPKTEDNLLTLHNDADEEATMQIRIPDTEVNVLEDNGKEGSGEYKKVITGEVVDPEHIRAGTYSGHVTFLVSYGLDTRELDLSGGSITITETGYTQDGEETDFHGHYRIRQSGGSTANSVAVEGGRDFRLALEGLDTTGDFTMTGTDDLEISMKDCRMDSAAFISTENAALTLTGTNTLVTDKNDPELADNGYSVIHPFVVPKFQCVEYNNYRCNELSYRFDELETYQTSISEKTARLSSGAFTAENSKIQVILPEEKDRLTLKSSRGDGDQESAATAFALTGSELTVDGKGTIDAYGGRFYSGDMEVSEEQMEPYWTDDGRTMYKTIYGYNLFNKDMFNVYTNETFKYFRERELNDHFSDYIDMPLWPSFKAQDVEFTIIASFEDWRFDYKSINPDKRVEELKREHPDRFQSRYYWPSDRSFRELEEWSISPAYYYSYLILDWMCRQRDALLDSRYYDTHPDEKQEALGELEALEEYIDFMPYIDKNAKSSDINGISAVLLDGDSGFTVNGAAVNLYMQGSDATAGKVAAVSGVVTVTSGAEEKAKESIFRRRSYDSTDDYICGAFTFTTDFKGGNLRGIVEEDEHKENNPFQYFVTRENYNNYEPLYLTTYQPVCSSEAEKAGTVNLNGGALNIYRNGVQETVEDQQFKVAALNRNGGTVNGN